MWVHVSAGLIGLLTSVVYVRYIRAVAKGTAASAAMFDFGIMFLGSVTSQLWFLHNGSFSILVTYDIVAAVGTYIAVKRL